MSDKKIITGLIIATIVILGAGVMLLSNTSSATITASQSAKAYTVDPTSYDWGNIPMYKGNVTKTFTIKNKGSDTLKLYNLKTSCHCTKTYVTIEGVDSPNFGMDSYSSWVGEVGSGKEAKLTVIFDPAFHGPQGIGPINRFVSVETNDRANTKLTFILTGIVIK